MDLHHPTFELPPQGQSPDTTFTDLAMPSCGAYKYQVTFKRLILLVDSTHQSIELPMLRKA